MFKPVNTLDQPVGLRGRKRLSRGCTVAVEFRKMIGPTERLARIAVHFVNLAGAPRAVAEINLDLDWGQCVCIVGFRLLDCNAPCKVLRMRVTKGLRAEVRKPHLATAERAGSDVGRAQTCVVARHLLRRWAPNQVIHERWHARFSALDLLCCQRVLLSQLKASLDDAVACASAREGLVCKLANEPAPAKMLDEVRRTTGLEQIEVAIWAFEHIMRARNASFRKVTGHHRITRSEPHLHGKQGV